MLRWRGGALVLAGGLALALGACSTRDEPPAPAVSPAPASSVEITSSDLGGAPTPTPTDTPGVGTTGLAVPGDGLLTPADLPSSWQVTQARRKTPASVVPKRCAVLNLPFSTKRTGSAVALFTGARASFLTDEVSLYPAPAATVVRGFAAAVRACATFAGGSTTFTAKPIAVADLGDASSAARVSSKTGSVTVTYDVALVSIGQTTVALTGGGLAALPSPFFARTLQAAATRAGGTS